MMEAVLTSETSVYFYETTRHYIPWTHLHTRRNENLISHLKGKYHLGYVKVPICEDNIKMDVQMECVCVNLIRVAENSVQWQDLVNTLMTAGFIKINISLPVQRRKYLAPWS
jgi:hypothetical protein